MATLKKTDFATLPVQVSDNKINIETINNENIENYDKLITTINATNQELATEISGRKEIDDTFNNTLIELQAILKSFSNDLQTETETRTANDTALQKSIDTKQDLMQVYVDGNTLYINGTFKGVNLWLK